MLPPWSEEALGAEYGEAAKADDDPEALKSNFKA